MTIIQKEQLEKLLNEIIDQNLSIEYWEYNIKDLKIDLELSVLKRSLSAINQSLINRNKEPFNNLKAFKEYLKNKKLIA